MMDCRPAGAGAASTLLAATGAAIEAGGRGGAGGSPGVTKGEKRRKKKKILKHGIQITVRGGYLDMLHYLAALEKMPVQMFWGEISFSVEKYPDAVLTLTLYTLSLGKTWLTV